MIAKSIERMGRFEVKDCLVPTRLTHIIEKFLLDKRTGNVRLNIKEGKILGIHVEEILAFRANND